MYTKLFKFFVIITCILIIVNNKINVKVAPNDIVALKVSYQ